MAVVVEACNSPAGRQTGALLFELPPPPHLRCRVDFRVRGSRIFYIRENQRASQTGELIVSTTLHPLGRTRRASVGGGGEEGSQGSLPAGRLEFLG